MRVSRVNHYGGPMFNWSRVKHHLSSEWLRLRKAGDANRYHIVLMMLMGGPVSYAFLRSNSFISHDRFDRILAHHHEQGWIETIRENGAPSAQLTDTGRKVIERYIRTGSFT